MVFLFAGEDIPLFLLTVFAKNEKAKGLDEALAGRLDHLCMTRMATRASVTVNGSDAPPSGTSWWSCPSRSRSGVEAP